MNKLYASTFKPIPGFNKYKISSTGVVYSMVRKHIIAVAYNHAGYRVVTITDDNGYRAPRKVHQLVYLAFIGPIDKDKIVDHIDDNKLNNYYMNLQQITPSENSRKTFISGANKNKAVWSKDEVKKICSMIERNKSNLDIFEELGISEGKKKNQCQLLIEQLRRGEIHKDIASQYRFQTYISGINKKDAKFNINEVMDIYMRLRMGEKPFQISKEYGVSFSTICKIRDKITWRNATNFVDQYFEESEDQRPSNQSISDPVEYHQAVDTSTE